MASTDEAAPGRDLSSFNLHWDNVEVSLGVVGRDLVWLKLVMVHSGAAGGATSCALGGSKISGWSKVMN
jgi:hypothetical protein